MAKSGVYKLTNIKNNSCYIGATTNIRRRKSQHFIGIKKKKHGNKLIDRDLYLGYTIDDFVFEVLEYCSPEELDCREQYWLNTINPSYNKKNIFTFDRWRTYVEHEDRILFEMQCTDRKRITIECSRQLHNEIKSRSSQMGISLKMYVLRALFNSIK
jgi:group I intron endonuclease